MATLIIAPTRIGDRDVRLLVDSGADLSIVCRAGPRIWQPATPGTARRNVRFMNGGAEPSMVLLQRLYLGARVLNETPALILVDPKPQRWDAILAIGNLGMNRIHSDFERGIMSWKD